MAVGMRPSGDDGRASLASDHRHRDRAAHPSHEPGKAAEKTDTGDLAAFPSYCGIGSLVS